MTIANSLPTAAPARQTPAARWRRWQREGRPTLGARKPLIDYLVSNARYFVEGALIRGAKGQPVAAPDLDELRDTVQDLLELGAAR